MARVYFWNGASWQPLDTPLDTTHNVASARGRGVGLYAFMSSVEIPLIAGWNLFAYPVNEERPIQQALLSIDGQYTSIYTYDPTGRMNWRWGAEQ